VLDVNLRAQILGIRLAAQVMAGSGNKGKTIIPWFYTYIPASRILQRSTAQHSTA
jgi:hypothetical protein